MEKFVFIGLCLVSFLSSSSLSSTVSSSSRGRECNEEEQKRMQTKFSECLVKYTHQHREDMEKRENLGKYQELLCEMLERTTKCGDLWRQCHSEDEVRVMKDMHIMARIQQFSGSQDGTNVRECPVVKEYLSSGRADQKSDGEESECTFSEVSEIQSAFQTCSHEKSTETWDKLREKAEEEENDDADTLTFDKSEVMPVLCRTLSTISTECVGKMERCFTMQDVRQIRKQHLKQMKDYYKSLYGFEMNCKSTTTTPTTTTTTPTTTTAPPPTTSPPPMPAPVTTTTAKPTTESPNEIKQVPSKEEEEEEEEEDYANEEVNDRDEVIDESEYTKVIEHKPVAVSIESSNGIGTLSFLPSIIAIMTFVLIHLLS